jgi:hypothetical protein
MPSSETVVQEFFMVLPSGDCAVGVIVIAILGR